MAQQNMYRVGDYVYFETSSPATPYQIRRIEELNKTVTGAVEAKVTCFFRRRDLPNSLLKIADQAERQNKILSNPRKTLLEIKDSNASATNGLLASTEIGNKQLKENGMESTTKRLADGEMVHSDGHQNKTMELDEIKSADEDADDLSTIYSSTKCYGLAGLPTGAEKLDPDQLHELRQRELFLSRIVETQPATQIRGKCAVVILNEVETCDMYLGQEDSFFYSLVYDPANQSLLADKGRIEIGDGHQANIPEMIVTQESLVVNNVHEEENNKDIKMEGITENEDCSTVSETPKTAGKNSPVAQAGIGKGVEVTDRERVVYHPYHNLHDLEIDQFLLVARAVGTFSRALDSSSSIKLPTLHQTASAASRDITLLHAMALLHQANYDLGKATKFLVPPADKQHYPLEADRLTSHNTSNLGGPILCRDQLEEWSAAESTLFEDAIEKYGKDFHDIRLDCLPWKSMRDIVEYYYMWKTTSRYSELQKSKNTEQENKLKQVYIPNYNKPNNLISNTVPQHKSTYPCESCNAKEAPHWYHWGPTQQLRLCGECWMVWKKRGGLKKPHELETYDLDTTIDGRFINRMAGRNGGFQSGNMRVAGAALSGILAGQRGRVAFYLNVPLETRVARRLAPKHLFNVRKAARSPFHEFNVKPVQDYYFTRPLTDVLHTARQIKRGDSPWAIEHLSKLHTKRISASESAHQNGGKN